MFYREQALYYNLVGVVTDRVRGLGYGPNLLKRGGAEELRSKPICQLTMSKGVQRPIASEGSAVVAVKGKFGRRQQLPLLAGEPEHEGVRSEPLKNCAT